MLFLTPVQLDLIRHTLNTACRLLNPAVETRRAFREGLLSLLQQTGEWRDARETGTYLAGVLRHTCLAPDLETPRENSSPVCYAHTQGLRPGFEEVAMPDPREVSPPPEGGAWPAGYLAPEAGFAEVLSATRNSVRQILSGRKSGLPANPALEKQIADLVDQLFGLPAGKADQPLRQPLT